MIAFGVFLIAILILFSFCLMSVSSAGMMFMNNMNDLEDEEIIKNENESLLDDFNDYNEPQPNLTEAGKNAAPINSSPSNTSGGSSNTSGGSSNTSGGSSNTSGGSSNTSGRADNTSGGSSNTSGGSSNTSGGSSNTSGSNTPTAETSLEKFNKTSGIYIHDKFADHGKISDEECAKKAISAGSSLFSNNSQFGCRVATQDNWDADLSDSKLNGFRGWNAAYCTQENNCNLWRKK